MKKFLIITTSYFPINGGQEIGLMKLLKGMSDIESDLNLTILTPRYNRSDPENDCIDGVSVIRYNSCRVRLIWRFLSKNLNTWLHIIYGFISIGKYIKKISPDFILIYFILPSGFPAMYYAKKYKIKNAVFVGGSDVFINNNGLKNAIKYTLSNADKIIGTSNFLLKEIQKIYEIKKDKTKKIPYGIDLNIVNKHLVVSDKKRDSINILCVQRLVKSKGTHYLLSALSKIADKQNIKIHLDIVGDGEEKKELEALSDKLNLSGYVTFHGNIDNSDIYGYYANSDIFVFPTTMEGFGIVLIEAMAFGKIIIASDCSSIPEIIENNHTGLLFKSGDVDDLADILKKVIANIEKYKYFGENAKIKVSQYDIPQISRKLLDQLN